MWTRPFGEEDAAEGDHTQEAMEQPADGADQTYSFEGFKVELSEKIMLTPIGPPAVPRAEGQWLHG
jgi:hypothetical protein